jgi:hypothetical protein
MIDRFSIRRLYDDVGVSGEGDAGVAAWKGELSESWKATGGESRKSEEASCDEMPSMSPESGVEAPTDEEGESVLDM